MHPTCFRHRQFLIFLSIFYVSLIFFGVPGSDQAQGQEFPLPEGTPLPNYALSIDLPPGHTALDQVGGLTSRGLPRIMLTGYWPPTNEMLRRFSPDPVQNPLGWIGADWEGRGYDVYAFFPEFPGGLGKGEGDFEVDYQDTSADFWAITATLQPVAIITFGRGSGNRSWEIEWRNRNLGEIHWGGDYLSPNKPTPSPPDATVSLGYVRYATHPMDAIAEAINATTLDINANVDYLGDSGAFLCEYIGYHASWYHDQHMAPLDPSPSISGGHIHVGSLVSLADATEAAKITVRTLIGYLDAPMLSPNPILRESGVDSVHLGLAAGAANALRDYLVLGSVTGQSPGIPLPGGTAVLPLNWDSFTNLGVTLVNTSVFMDFMGTLDASGTALASFNPPALPAGSSGIALNFAYALAGQAGSGWYASNAVEVKIVP